MKPEKSIFYLLFFSEKKRTHKKISFKSKENHSYDCFKKINHSIDYPFVIFLHFEQFALYVIIFHFYYNILCKYNRASKLSSIGRSQKKKATEGFIHPFIACRRYRYIKGYKQFFLFHYNFLFYIG